MTEHDIIVVREKIAEHKKELSELLHVKKAFRDHRKITDLMNRINTQKMWLKKNKVEKVIDPKVTLKIYGRKQMIEKRRKEFEAMLVKLDKNPESKTSVVFKNKDDVDSVIDLIHREITKEVPRTNLNFVGTDPLIGYMRNLIRKKIMSMSTTKAEQKMNDIAKLSPEPETDGTGSDKV